jgi:hypothetical protein
MTAVVNYNEIYTNTINNIDEFNVSLNIHRAIIIRNLLSSKVLFSLQKDDEYISDDEEVKVDELEYEDTKLCITTVEDNNENTKEISYENFIYLYQTSFLPEILKDLKKRGVPNKESLLYDTNPVIWLTSNSKCMEDFEDLFESIKIILYYQ